MADTAPDFTTDISGPIYTLPRLVTFENVIDCAADPLTDDTSHALFDIPKGYVHISTVVEVLVAEGGTATADIGITGGDVDCLIDGVDLNAAVGTLWESGSAGTAEAHSLAGATAGFLTNSATTFSLLNNDALDACKFRVTSVWLDLSTAVTG